MGKIFAPKDPSQTEAERAHLALSRRAAAACMVLLKNDGALPLEPGPVALFGNGARQTVRGGTGSGDVNARSAVSVEQGLINAGFSVTTEAWLDRQEARHADALAAYWAWVPEYAAAHGMPVFFTEFSHHFRIPEPCPILMEDMAGGDTAVYVIARTSGEGADRHDEAGDYRPYAAETEQLRALTAAYRRLVVVLNVGGVIDLAEIAEMPGVSAVLLMGQAGSAGGDALADVLTGKVNPSGRLTDTWARRYADYPSAATYSHNDGNLEDEAYTEGILVGYRWFDAFSVRPLFPFGFGLSYTAFAWGRPSVSVERGECRVTLPVENTGTRAGRDVVQLYCRQPEGELPKAPRVLAAWAKTRLLQPGERETVAMRFAVSSLASYSERHGAWILEAGDYVLETGRNEADVCAAAVLTLPRAAVTAQLRNQFPDPDPVREIEIPRCPGSAPEDAPRIALDPDAVQALHPAYTKERPRFTTDKIRRLTLQDVRAGRCTASELVAQLTAGEMAALCVGTEEDGGLTVGSSSRLVPGAAGETSGILEETRGIRSLVTADGPAGLRLTPVFRAAEDGTLIPDGDGRPGETHYQYCTAIPVGWCLAQSWDPAMVREVGAMIGEEMARFGVDLWLAPALNIHRNPLCGRNFEYYSEDPLISGAMAAAITAGVQSVPGRGVTVKHFAANSQEDNRYFTNAHVSERALREIYLRGFEIAVREGKPAALMTSYNLLCGTHTANHRGLLQGVLRDEWGYEGLVMTDWCTSQDVPELTGGGGGKYPISSSVGCVAAGNDLQMPGCRKNREDIVRAVEQGGAADGYAVTLSDLQQCALRVVRAVLAADAQPKA